MASNTRYRWHTPAQRQASQFGSKIGNGRNYLKVNSYHLTQSYTRHHLNPAQNAAVEANQLH